MPHLSGSISLRTTNNTIHIVTRRNNIHTADLHRNTLRWTTLLLLLFTLLATPRLYLHILPNEIAQQEWLTTDTQQHFSAVIDDNDATNIAIIKAQQDLSDAIFTYRNPTNNISENAARTRRLDFSRRNAFSNVQMIAHKTVQCHIAAAATHQLNTDIALSRVLPLNLPTEQIPFPFHTFW